MSSSPLKRVLIKCSGEFFSDSSSVYSAEKVTALAKMIQSLYEKEMQVAIVCGGGNIWRWKDTQGLGLPRVRSDYLGIMATVMNATVLANALHSLGYDAVPMVPQGMHHHEVTTQYNTELGQELLSVGSIIVCGGGTGNPYATTDSGAVLRALELGCDAVVKVTTVDGVYDKDPNVHTDAKKYSSLTHADAVKQGLNVMDMSAFGMAKENGLAIYVCEFNGVATLGTDGFTGTYIHA